MVADFPTDALTVWLADHIEGFAGPIDIEKFSGGQSNPTYRVLAASGAYVLRRKPFGELLPSAHAVDREYRLLAALHPSGFPVPRTYGLSMDPTIIGAPFYVMDLVEGRNFTDGSLPGLAPSERRQVYLRAVDAPAALHTTVPESVGLGDYGRPGNYFERQVARWTRQYRASQTDDVPAMEKLIEWLPATLPAQNRSSIVHGDYRIDNLIVGVNDSSVRAVLDWELSTIGDPLADFAYFALNWIIPADGKAFLGGLDLDALDIPLLAEVTERYCAATGRAEIPDLHWHFAYNQFRIAAILQGIKRRLIDGNASSAEAAARAAQIPGIAGLAWASAQQLGALE